MRYIFLTPWKISPRSDFYEAYQGYLKRLSKDNSVQVVSPTSTLETASDVTNFLHKELKKLASEGVALVCFDENGKTLPSAGFAQMLANFAIKGARGVCFCFGSAYGLPAELASLPRLELVSLSPLTMAHELALVVAAEQVYRAQCILAGHPYHHGERSELAKVLKK